MKDRTVTNVRKVAFEWARPGSAAGTLGALLLLWLLFFLICFGLGYPTLNRYLPSRVSGLSDSAIYYQMVTGAPSNRRRAEVFQGRILVPYIARPLYRIAESRMHSWDPVYFALLVSNSLFSATTSLLLLGAGLAVTRNPGIALCAALLYLLNFAVSDLQLAGLVDSGEACFMMLLTWALLRGRWWLLPLAGIGGALAKETFVAFALVFVIVWWWRSRPRPAVRSRESGYILALIVLGELTTIAIHFFTEGQLVTPWHIAATMNSHSNYLLAFFRSISDRSFWYVFGWLLPLGIWRWRCLPREWVSAALAAALVALAFGVYNDMGGTVARPIFDVAGPMLTLATVILVSGLVARLFSPTQIAANE